MSLQARKELINMYFFFYIVHRVRKNHYFFITFVKNLMMLNLTKFNLINISFKDN